MLSVLGLGLMAWFVSLCIRSARDVKRAKANRAEILRRIERLEENQEILAQNVLRNRSKIDSFEARYAKEVKARERLEAKVEKEAAKRRKMEQLLNVSTNEVDFQKEKVARLQKLLEATELERDACVVGGSNYCKLERKALAIENQIRTAYRKMEKAQFDISEADRVLREVA